MLFRSQYGDTSIEKENLQYNYQIDIHSLENLDKFNQIDSLASLIDACDLIVTTSNVTAHISGALGKKTFLLLPYNAKSSIWYWMHNKVRSLWYPTVKIYRADKMATWSDIINKLTNDLKRNYE